MSAVAIETSQLILRITARCSGTLFLLGFGAAGWATLQGCGLARRRRALLLGFGAIHTIHASFRGLVEPRYATLAAVGTRRTLAPMSWRD